MSATFTPSLSRQQLADFHEEGYLIVRNALSAGEAADLRRVVREQALREAYPPRLSYPEPAKYTVSGNRMAEPGLAAIAEHPAVVGAVESALGGPAHLTASVAYLRTPGDKGGGAHSDYKRWRPVGSSMNWVFAIIPLNDFDPSFGPFMVSPGSHKLPRVINPDAHILDLTEPDREQLPPFIDPELKAGDLLVVNEHVWHQAPARHHQRRPLRHLQQVLCRQCPAGGGVLSLQPGSPRRVERRRQAPAAGVLRPADYDDPAADRAPLRYRLAIPVVP